MKARILLAMTVCAACRATPPPSPAEVLTATHPALREAREVEVAGMPSKAREVAADDARDTLVTIDSDRRFAIVRAGGDAGAAMQPRLMRDIMKDGGCGHGPDNPLLGHVSVGVSGDGREAWFLAMEGSKTPPMRTLSAACIVDVATGSARSLRTELRDPVHLRAHSIERDAMPSIMIGRHVAVLWGQGDELEVVHRASRRSTQLDVGLHAGPCHVREAGSELAVACVTNPAAGRLSLARFDVTQSPPLPIGRADVDVEATQPDLVLSTDGRWVGFRARTRVSNIPVIGVVDMKDGKVLGAVLLVWRRALAFDIAPKRKAMVVTYSDGPTVITPFDGNEQGRFDLGCRPRALFATPDASRVWCHSVDDELSLRATAP